MRSESVAWKLAQLVALLLTAVIPAFVAYDLHAPAPDPEKRLELSSFGAINPLRDLSVLGDQATISVTVGDEVFNNLVITRAYFENTGNQPILPNDFHQNLSATVDEPWRIVAVENQVGVPLEWTRISDTRFEAAPALINPGDKVTLTVYLTNTEYSGLSEPRMRPEPQVQWDARITNLRGFSKPRLLHEEHGFAPLWDRWIIVFLVGWAVPFTIATALLFQALYVHFLVRLELLSAWRWRSTALILGTTLISVPAAEAIATYIFKDPLSSILGVDHGLNLAIIVINATLLALLWWRTGRKSEKAPLHAG